MEKVIVRVPPSPTGRLHIGTARTMLFNYLFAKQKSGKILFRSEDTDKERSKREYEDDILDGLAWLGLAFDNAHEVYRQSEHTDVYKKYLQKLLDSGAAYISKETPTEPGGRTEVIRFKNPGKSVTFNDIIRGEVTFDTTELGDFVIAKSLDEPLYHLAVVVDDIEQGVTHIIRGDDHISNTARQILIQEALGAARPVYAHIPLILMPDRSKMSKRKHGEVVSVGFYRTHGYLPEAMINFLAFLGWNPGTEQEIFSIDELIKAFDLSKVQKAGAVFNVEKLNWFNKEYIQKLDTAKQLEWVEKFLPEQMKKLDSYSREKLERGLPIILERIEKFGDVKTMSEAGEFNYLFAASDFNRELVLQNLKVDVETVKKHLQHVKDTLSSIESGEFTAENIKTALWDYATEAGRANVLWPLRVVLTELPKSPDPFTVSAVIGQQETNSRINDAISAL